MLHISIPVIHKLTNTQHAGELINYDTDSKAILVRISIPGTKPFTKAFNLLTGKAVVDKEWMLEQKYKDCYVKLTTDVAMTYKVENEKEAKRSLRLARKEMKAELARQAEQAETQEIVTAEVATLPFSAPETVTLAPSEFAGTAEFRQNMRENFAPDAPTDSFYPDSPGIPTIRTKAKKDKSAS